MSKQLSSFIQTKLKIRKIENIENKYNFLNLWKDNN